MVRLMPDRIEKCPVCGQPDNCGDCDHEPCGEVERARAAWRAADTADEQAAYDALVRAEQARR
jgi:hypothetical protein